MSPCSVLRTQGLGGWICREGGTQLLRQGRKQDRREEGKKTRQGRRIEPEEAADSGGGRSEGEPGSRQGGHKGTRAAPAPGTGDTRWARVQGCRPGGRGAGAALYRPRQRTTTPHTLSVPCISYLEAP